MDDDEFDELEESEEVTNPEKEEVKVIANKV